MLVAGVALVACSEPATLSSGTLAPLGTGTLPPVVTTAPGTTSPLAPTTAPPSGLPTTTERPKGQLWGGWPYYEVPQLGTESVRGTGCGSTGGLGEALGDGVWNVLIGDGTGLDDFWTDSTITVDVRCVYTGVGGQSLWTAACTADPNSPSCLGNTADWYVVNSNGRLRTMPVSANVQYGVGALGDSPCPSPQLDRTASDAPWRFMDSWVVVDGGVVSAVITACPAG